MISPRPSERPTGQTGRGPTMPRGLEPLKVEKKKYPNFLLWHGSLKNCEEMLGLH